MTAATQGARRLAASVLPPTLTFLGACLVLEALARFGNMPAYIVPAPSAVIETLFDRLPRILANSWYTAYVTVVGFAIALAVGVLLAIGIVSWRPFDRAVSPLLVVAQVIPKVAIAPILIVYLGYGIEPRIVLAFLIAFFPVVINTVLGLRSVDPNLLHLLQSLRATRTQVLLKVRLPNSLPYAVSGAKIAITLALIGTVVGEFTAGEFGLGVLIQVTSAQLDTPMTFAALIALSLIGLITYWGVGALGALIARIQGRRTL